MTWSSYSGISDPTRPQASFAPLALFFMSSIFWGFRVPVARPKSVSLTCPVPSTRKFCARRSVSCESARSIHLWLQIAMDISELVQLVDSREHEEGTEVASGDVLLSRMSAGLSQTQGYVQETSSLLEEPTIAR